MRKVSEYLDHAAECRQMATRMKDPIHKKQLEEMTEAWTMLARERKKQLAKMGNGTNLGIRQGTDFGPGPD
jgi:hypothetical protein